MLPRPPRRAAPPPRRPDRESTGHSLRFAALRLGCGLALAVGCSLTPQARAQKGSQPPPDYVQFGKPDQKEGRDVLEEFRRQGIAGEYYLEFELRVLPWHGPEQVLAGKLWGSRNAAGPISRISVPQSAAAGAPEVRLLIQGGPSPALWRWTAGSGAQPEAAGIDTLFEPIGGTDLTAFDLQMPFLYWPDFVYEGLARMHGRPAHQFLFYPPADVTRHNPLLRGVRTYLDTQYGALVQAELIGADNQPLKILSLLDLKKVGDQWIPKTVDFRNETTRNKTRFAVTAAALSQAFPPDVFDPAHLAEAAATPAELVRLADP